MQTETRIKGSGFHHISIKVKDFDACVRFYEEGLGFPRRHAWMMGEDPAVMLDMGDGGIVEIFGGGDEDVPDGKIGHFALRVDDCDAAYRTAMEAGASSHLEPKDVVICDGTYPIRIAFIRGTAGELVELFEEKDTRV